MHAIMEYLVTLFSLLLPFSVATVVSFDGNQHVRIELPEESRTEAEDITLRFQSPNPNGLLFATTSTNAADHMELMLDNGQLRLDIELGSGVKVGHIYLYISYMQHIITMT